MYDYIIIGGGVTGITLCKKLREKGIDNIPEEEMYLNLYTETRTKISKKS